MQHRSSFALVAGLALLASARPLATQPPVAPAPAAQNPSPMVERTRAHERLVPRELTGTRRRFVGPGGREVALLVPERVSAADAIDLVVHFHGAEWLAEQSVAALGDGRVSTVVNLGAGSGAYDRAFADPAAFDSLLAGIVREVGIVRGTLPPLGTVTLSGFSAGHGAIRAILREPRHVGRVDAVLLLDGMHTGYVPEGRPVADGGALDPAPLRSLLAFAEAAIREEKSLLVTHSEIFPGTFASTTETADWLLEALGLERTTILAWGPRGMQQLSEVRQGRLHVQGFAGNSAPDHVDHFHAMPELLAALVEDRKHPRH